VARLALLAGVSLPLQFNGVNFTWLSPFISLFWGSRPFGLLLVCFFLLMFWRIIYPPPRATLTREFFLLFFFSLPGLTACLFVFKWLAACCTRYPFAGFNPLRPPLSVPPDHTVLPAVFVDLLLHSSPFCLSHPVDFTNPVFRPSLPWIFWEHFDFLGST